VQGASEAIRFVAGATRTQTPEVKEFAKAQGFKLCDRRPWHRRRGVVHAPLDARATDRRGIRCRQACIL
jgi:hypothetical protein